MIRLLKYVVLISAMLIIASIEVPMQKNCRYKVKGMDIECKYILKQRDGYKLVSCDKVFSISGEFDATQITRTCE
jgi:hypothetical protein